MDELVIYEKPTCSKCRVAISILDARGEEYRRVRYHDERLTQEKLAELVRKLNMPARDLVRTNEPTYKALGRDVRTMDDAEVIALLAAHPELLQRPILECGDTAVLGRPTENVTAFLNTLAHTRH